MLLFCLTLAIFYLALSRIKKQNAPKKNSINTMNNRKIHAKNFLANGVNPINYLLNKPRKIILSLTPDSRCKDLTVLKYKRNRNMPS